ncbi:hypothetical protein [Virgibacillus indicus]|nr:hypothetical protein [Virgibacillus indicus]
MFEFRNYTGAEKYPLKAELKANYPFAFLQKRTVTAAGITVLLMYFG